MVLEYPTVDGDTPVTQSRKIPYWEQVRGYGKQYTNTGAKVTSLRLVKLADATNFITDMLGNVGIVAGPSVVNLQGVLTIINGQSRVARLTRTLPESYDIARPSEPTVTPRFAPPYCTAVDFDSGLNPDASVTNRLIFSHVFYTCHFETLPYNVRSDAYVYGNNPRTRRPFAVPELQRFVQREVNWNVESLPVPGGQYVFTNDSIPLNEPVPKPTNIAEVTFTWHQVLRPPLNSINAAIGRVNAVAFDTEVDADTTFPLYNYPPETLLMTGVDLQVHRHWAGYPLFNVVYKFAYRNAGPAVGGGVAGWNHLYRVAKVGVPAGYYRVADRATRRNGIYLKAFFNALFTPAPQP